MHIQNTEFYRWIRYTAIEHFIEYILIRKVNYDRDIAIGGILKMFKVLPITYDPLFTIFTKVMKLKSLKSETFRKLRVRE